MANVLRAILEAVRKAKQEFGHRDHVPRVGAEDIRQTLGMILNLPNEYNLETAFDAALLDRFNIPDLREKVGRPTPSRIAQPHELKVQAESAALALTGR